VARWAGGAKWGEAPAPHDQRDTPLALSLSEWLGPRGRQVVCDIALSDDNIASCDQIGEQGR
jgi:hypothetical protein